MGLWKAPGLKLTEQSFVATEHPCFLAVETQTAGHQVSIAIGFQGQYLQHQPLCRIHLGQ